MRILVAMRQPSLGGGVLGGVETAALELQRCGHDVVVYSQDDLPWRDSMERRGLRTLGSLAGVTDPYDVAIAHDQPSAYDVLVARPDVPLTFVWHGNIYDVDMSPQLDDAIKLVFQLYGPLPNRADAISVKAPIVQVRQPIDVERFSPLAPIGEVPRRAVVLSNYTSSERRTVLKEACERAGIELNLFGFQEERGRTAHPELVINDADIVFAKGRAAMEAMACGRAVFVCDFLGTDGFVTQQNFEQVVSSGIAGDATQMVGSVDAIVTQLRTYDAQMGAVNRDLALHHFRASTHAAELVVAIEKMLGEAPRAPHNDASFELARLSRISWGFEQETHVLRHRMNEAERRSARADSLVEENAALRERIASMEGSRRWRAVQGILAPFDRLRGGR